MPDLPLQPASILFLPGALGRTDFWHPVADGLAHPARKTHVGWPGFGGVPADPSIRSLDDLADRLCAGIDEPTALVAQSMGGIVAVLAALRKPGRITHLVLSVTSGGIDMAALGAQDWRPAVRVDHPTLPGWFLDHRDDLSAQLRTLEIPTLLLWGDADPVSPVAAGRRLAQLLPRARLHVVAGGGHDLGHAFAGTVIPLIDGHLGSADTGQK
jgi:pimeloyl-ACP methyl ester carboxylesterase